MKKLYSPIALLAITLLAGSCKKDDDMEIVSLGTAGREFYFGEKVAVWATTTGGDVRDIRFDWSATGGSFDGWRTQNLYENLWVAPAQAGEYTVTVTAKKGGTTSTRSSQMKVTKYFFDEFQDNFTFNGAGWAQSNTTTVLRADSDPLKSFRDITASSTSGPNIRRPLTAAPLKIPFSVSANFGWKTFFRASSTITFSIFFEQPEANPDRPYMREIRWEIWPTVNPATTDNYQVRYETFVPQDSKSSKFSANTNTAATLPAPMPLINPVKGRVPALAMAANQEKRITFSIDANNIFHAYIDGQKWFESTGFKQWIDYCKAKWPDFEAPLAKEFRIALPARASANDAGSTLFLNSVYIVNDGEVLK
ncbi:hypothetical protein ACWKWU_22570 [Chitinophaga lutea]